MPGYLGGGGSSSGGAGGEIRFPKEFIDPVTKLRVSTPENLIDTDFEYGLQPTKWETVELINNTPSFFSKSGDTTIDGILSITTNAGTREITVRTALEHLLAVGIPINVQGTKSVTADGSYIINSIPDEFTFTYLARDNQTTTSSIEDLYSSVITGEFFQGSQLRIKSIVTDGAPISELTVTTEATHGFGTNTPFYFLNLNSTIAQEFPASNTELRSFDSSNSATAQTFDGSNTLSSINIDFSNSATSGGFASSVTTGVNSVENDTITVNHPAEENFVGLKLGQALYYNVAAGSGFFQANPRGVVFLKTTNELGVSQSTFQVSEAPNGNPINITGAMSGTFQIANQARTFAGNNINVETEVSLSITDDDPMVFDGANENGKVAINPAFDGTDSFVLTSQSGTADISWSFNTMVLFTTDGAAPTGLSNNTTYFVNQSFQIGSSNTYLTRISEFPNQGPISISNDGTGDMIFTEIGISLDKDIIHIKNHNLQEFDMVKYTYPENGRFGADQAQDFYYVQTVFDANNFNLTFTLGDVSPKFQSYGPVDYGDPITPSEVIIVGFEAPYTFTVTEGVLPVGLTLNESTGVVSGTPNEVYNNQVVITLTDTNGSQGEQTIAFEFLQPPFLYAFSSAGFGTGGNEGQTGPTEQQAESSLGNPDWANDYFRVGTRGFQIWTVPQSGDYRIRAAGARAGGGGGGRGAVIESTHSLTQGEEVTVIVGQRGQSSNSSGGGGGSFVWRNQGTSLLTAAGGGGGQYNGGFTGVMNARYDTPGNNSSRGERGGQGGNGGAGGSQCSPYGGGGAGWNGNGGQASSCRDSYGRGRGAGFIGGNTCSRARGGFGGAGGTHGNTGGGGGGAGYSGGAGHGHCGTGAGGGGSYAAQAQTNIGQNSGNGYVNITKL